MALTNPDIAARLHDGPVQQLTAAQLFIELGMNQLRDDGVPGLGEEDMLPKGLSALRGAIAAIRELMEELHADEDP